MFDWDKIGERITKIIEHFQVRSQAEARKTLRAQIAAQLFAAEKTGDYKKAVEAADELLYELDKS